MAHPVTDREAQQGQKMIEVKLRFWTNDIAGEGKIRPRHAWSNGVVRIERNESHGIVPGSPLPFHSLLDVGSVIERALIEHGIILHPSRRMAKYLSASATHGSPTASTGTPGRTGRPQAADEEKALARSEATRKANAARTPAERSEASRKANATRKARGGKA